MDITRIDASCGTVSKYLFKGEDVAYESVLYGYPDYSTRTVMCIATQAGCPVGCKFCGVGHFFVRSLREWQITEQVSSMLDDAGINPDACERMQIMFMSMGEPMLNHRNLFRAIRTLNALYPKAALLISTIGPKVENAWLQLIELSRVINKIGLQFSIHETTDERRNKLIPFEKKLSLEGIAQVGEAWALQTGRRPFFNYCAHEGNVTEGDADRLLGTFLPEIWEATISVICEKDKDLAVDHYVQMEPAKKMKALLDERGYSTRLFNPAGQDDIGGGCGQLWFVQDWAKDHPDLIRQVA